MRRLGRVWWTIAVLALAAGCVLSDHGDPDGGRFFFDSSLPDSTVFRPDARVDSAVFVDAAVCSPTVVTLTPTEFCARYAATCGFAVPQRFLSEGDCWMLYNQWVSSRQQCATYHLCNAAGSGQATLHCPHATGLSVCTP